MQKPLKNQPYNHCGYCCSTQPCQLAVEHLHSNVAPCVALEIKDGVSTCGLVRNPLGYIYAATRQDRSFEDAIKERPHPSGIALSVMFAHALGLGTGCDSDDNSESSKAKQTPIMM